MTKHIIRQLWKEYEDTGNFHRLVDIVATSKLPNEDRIKLLWWFFEKTGDTNRVVDIIQEMDMTSDFQDGEIVKAGVVKHLRKISPMLDKTANAARDKWIHILHQEHLDRGMSITESYRKIRKGLEELGVHKSEDAIRKILKQDRNF